ncbi:hypothetical protein E4U13_007262 [Claviceps humidiphila]|uniref:Uncharacterized protein n=1 Tax=Claviceps humidiphila TaxID=1294629 RepID=A0A9P7Q855_9HYPO|nr:hypothetical protein E4U13_007262 [Claviceps humidiphila]
MAQQSLSTSAENENGKTRSSPMVTLTWGVYGKTDRVHFVELDTYYFLDGRPEIISLNIESSIRVNVFCYTDLPDAPPVLVCEGPAGIIRFAAQQFGAYRVQSYQYLFGMDPPLFHPVSQ